MAQERALKPEPDKHAPQGQDPALWLFPEEQPEKSAYQSAIEEHGMCKCGNPPIPPWCRCREEDEEFEEEEFYEEEPESPEENPEKEPLEGSLETETPEETEVKGEAIDRSNRCVLVFSAAEEYGIEGLSTTKRISIIFSDRASPEERPGGLRAIHAEETSSVDVPVLSRLSGQGRFSHATRLCMNGHSYEALRALETMLQNNPAPEWQANIEMMLFVMAQHARDTGHTQLLTEISNVAATYGLLSSAKAGFTDSQSSLGGGPPAPAPGGNSVGSSSGTSGGGSGAGSSGGGGGGAGGSGGSS